MKVTCTSSSIGKKPGQQQSQLQLGLTKVTSLSNHTHTGKNYEKGGGSEQGAKKKGGKGEKEKKKAEEKDHWVYRSLVLTGGP